MSLDNISAIVVGALNTDVIGLGVHEIPKPGEHTSGEELKILPGGKSRNIAQMMALFTGPDTVAMIGKTSRDPFNLWKLPIDALKESGVNIDYIKVLGFEETKKMPGIALITVDKNGNNQICVLPGISEEFSSHDVDDALPLFEAARKNSGILALSLELPLSTAIHSIKRANEHKLKVILDPGGISKRENHDELLNQEIFMIKPNEHEAKILTGVDVKDFESAKNAANCFIQKGIKNILITVGKDGAYLFTDSIQQHIPIPKIQMSETKDETGCGDQTTATLCASLSQGKDILESSKLAVLAGTLQFNRAGVSPITKADLHKYTVL